MVTYLLAGEAGSYQWRTYDGVADPYNNSSYITIAMAADDNYTHSNNGVGDAVHDVERTANPNNKRMFFVQQLALHFNSQQAKKIASRADNSE